MLAFFKVIDKQVPRSLDNIDPVRLVWHAAAADIIEKVRRGRNTLLQLSPVQSGRSADATEHRLHGSGTLTSLTSVDPFALQEVDADPVEICRPVAGLVVQPEDARALGLPEDRFATNFIRPANELVRYLLGLDPAPVTVARTPQLRIVGTCRHFAVLACALLRHRGGRPGHVHRRPAARPAHGDDGIPVLVPEDSVRPGLRRPARCSRRRL